MNESIKGRFIWHELITSDTKAAARFYSKVGRLTTQKAPSDAGYTMLVGSGQPMGGLLDTAKMGGAPRWLSFIVSLDADETARQAASLGGKVLLGPVDLPNGGRSAILQDPQGAAFAVWSSHSAPQLAPAVPLGGMSWHELATADRAPAFLFYQQLFDWHETGTVDMGAQGPYQMFAPAGVSNAFGGIYAKAPQAPGGPNWLPYIKVADARPATAVAKKNGAQILHGPAQVPGGGWITMGVDPQGALFAIHSTASQPNAAKPTRKPVKRKQPKRKPTKKASRARKRVAAKKKKTGAKKRRR
jgi:hypothetical protein